MTISAELKDFLLVIQLFFRFDTFFIECFVDWYDNGKKVTLGIHDELEHGRAVFLESPDGIWEACIASFDEVQLFEKITYAPVAIPSGTNLIILDIGVADASVKAGAAGDFNILLCYADSDRLMNLIRTMVYSIGKDFLNSCKRVIIYALCFRLIA